MAPSMPLLPQEHLISGFLTKLSTYEKKELELSSV